MSKFLIADLYNRYFSRTFDLQSNKFQIIDVSSGLILDSLIDLDFLAYVLNFNSDFLLDKQGCILLNSQQQTRYNLFKMYYYNPLLLRSELLNRFNSCLYLSADFEWNIYPRKYNNSNVFLEPLHNLTSSGSNYFFNANLNIYKLSFSKLGNNFFQSFVFPHNLRGVIYQNPLALNVINHTKNFTLCFVFFVNKEFNNNCLFEVKNVSDTSYLRFFYSNSYGASTFKIDRRDSNSNTQTISKVFYEGLNIFKIIIIRFSNSEINFCINDTNFYSYSRNFLVDENLDNIYFTSDVNGSYGSYLSIFDLFIINDSINDSGVEFILDYFKTKYFLTI